MEFFSNQLKMGLFITSTDLDIVCKDLGQSWSVSMSQRTTQPLGTTEIVFKHKHTSKDTHIGPKERRWPLFVRRALGPRPLSLYSISFLYLCNLGQLA